MRGILKKLRDSRVPPLPDASPAQDTHGRAIDLEVLLWVGGDPGRADEALSRTLTGLSEAWPDCPVTLLIDGPDWRDLLKPFPSSFPNCREIALPSAADRPQVLYALGMLRSRHPYVAFSWPGCRIDPQGLSRLRAAASDADLAYGDFLVEDEESATLPSRLARRRAGTLVPAGLHHPVQYGWLQMLDCIPMHNCVVRRDILRQCGLFDPAPWLRRHFWWDFTIRLGRFGRIAYCPSPSPEARWTWSGYPFRHRSAEPEDLAARYCAFPRRVITDEEGLRRAAESLPEAFLRDLGHAGVSLVGSATTPGGGSVAVSDPATLESVRVGDESLPRGRWPVRVTVLAGFFDAHHSQLYFFNYFERLAGRGLVTWRTILYDTCLPSDLDGSDLVVFSRPRYPECPALLDHCRRQGIATLLMIDDNWIAAGREYPRYAPLFAPGAPPFEVFLKGLREADAVLVFTERLEEDVRPLARRVLRMPPNVDLSHFSPGGRDDGTFVAGFVGSPRFDQTGFHALARFAVRHDDVSVFVMAHELPEALSGAPRVRFLPYRHNYFAYARAVSSARPDVLIAPLDDTRFSASKCPVKYLETAAIGAAGVYSAVPLYTECVEDGKTGLLVHNDLSAWLEALERLYADPGLRAGIAKAARAEVAERYSTERLIPDFVKVLQDAIRVTEGGTGT